MKTAIFALALTACLGAAAIPAFADSGDTPERLDSANSLPPGFYKNTPFAMDARIREQHFANEGEASSLVQRGVISPVAPQAHTQNHG
jgi:hypothetical protein